MAGCLNTVNYDCPTKIGTTFRGCSYAFDSTSVVDLEINWFSQQNIEQAGMKYTVANGKLIKPNAQTWQMVNTIFTNIPAGAYRYEVLITYNTGDKDIAVQGTKIFTL